VIVCAELVGASAQEALHDFYRRRQELAVVVPVVRVWVVRVTRVGRNVDLFYKPHVVDHLHVRRPPSSPLMPCRNRISHFDQNRKQLHPPTMLLHQLAVRLAVRLIQANLVAVAVAEAVAEAVAAVWHPLTPNSLHRPQP
jgi:hypothetical protein